MEKKKKKTGKMNRSKLLGNVVPAGKFSMEKKRLRKGLSDKVAGNEVVWDGLEKNITLIHKQYMGWKKKTGTRQQNIR